MKKKMSKKFIVGIVVVVGIVLGGALMSMLVPTVNGLETKSGFKASCIELFEANSAGNFANEDLIEGVNNGIEEYIGTRIKMEYILVYREIDSRTFVASTSGVGVYNNDQGKIFTGETGKTNYLIQMDKTGKYRFVLTGKSTIMHWLKEPGPYEGLQLCDIYGTYEGTMTIKDTDGTETILPLIRATIVDKSPN